MSDSTHKVPIGKTIVIITQVITTSDQLNQSLEDLLWYTQHDDLKRLVGLDVEKHYSSSISSTSSIEKVSAVMLCCGNYCLIIQLLHMDSNASCYLSKFLQLEGLTFVGVQIQHCLKALDRDYGIKCRNALDLGQLPRIISKNKQCLEGYGVVDLAYKVKQFHFLHPSEAQKYMQ